MNPHVKITLSVYPNNRGFGYVVMEGSHILVDYGISNVSPLVNSEILTRVRDIFDIHHPTELLLRDCTPSIAKRSKRMARLTEALVKLGEEKNVPVFRYSREQVKNAFEQFGANTKYEIAQKLAAEFEELKNRAPEPRKPWKDEDYSMGIFDALAIIGTHHFLKE